jgi:hypothetical protein
MKRSFDTHTNVPATDRKFRLEDEHLLAKNKEEVALNPHTLAPEHHDKHDHGEAQDAAKKRTSTS